MSREKTEPYNFRVNKDQLEAAKDKVDLPALLRKVIAEVAEDVCPTCGTHLKKEKKK